MPGIVGYNVPTWRWILADSVDGSTITILDRHARDRSIELALNTPTKIQGTVSSDDPEINTLHTDGFPFLAEGDRLIYCLRRDYNGDFNGSPYYCRAAGTILQLEDNAFSEGANTTFVAYDPWQYLYNIPVWTPNDPFLASGLATGNYPTTYYDTNLSDIILELLINADDDDNYPDVFTRIDWGQTIFYGGTIETLPAITHTFSQELTIGEAFDELVALGMCDIVLNPIYDPVNRPGFLAELNVFAQAGEDKPDAVFAWDKPSRSTDSIDRSLDGTQRSNTIRFHVGLGGTGGTQIPVIVTEPLSIARFGAYWSSQDFVAATQDETVQNYADDLLSQVSEHKRSVSIGVMPERSPDPFLEYNLGDSVQIWASRNFRNIQAGFQRVTAFVLQITDDALEHITGLSTYIPNDTSGSDGVPDTTPPEFQNATVDEDTLIMFYDEELI